MQIQKVQKQALVAQESFGHRKFSLAPRSRGQCPRQECVCKARSRLLQPPVMVREKADSRAKERHESAQERKVMIMGREIERVSWDGKELEKELRRKGRLGAERPWLGGIFRRLERSGSGVYHLSFYPNAAKSQSCSSPLTSDRCGKKCALPSCLQEEQLPFASGSSL